MSPKFDYLRALSAGEVVMWRGQTQAGITPTTYEWARIEKAIALQMAYDVSQSFYKLDGVNGQEFATKYRNRHGFFALNRRINKTRSHNSTYRALLNGKRKKIETKRDKLFGPRTAPSALRMTH